MVAAIVWGTVLHYLLITFCYAATRIRYSQVRASGPRRPPVGVDELDPYELALLAGGRPRVGEVAVAELFLTGRITAWGPGMVAGVAQQSAPAPPGLSDSPFVRALSVRLAVNRPLAVDRLVSAATCGDAITAVLWRLRRLGLFLPPERLRAMAVLRRAAWLSQLVLGAVTVLAAGFLVGWTVSSAPANRSLVPLLLVVLLGYPFLLHVAFRAAGGLGAVGMAALVVAVSGGRVFAGGVAGCRGAVRGLVRVVRGLLGDRGQAGAAHRCRGRAVGGGPCGAGSAPGCAGAAAGDRGGGAARAAGGQGSGAGVASGGAADRLRHGLRLLLRRRGPGGGGRLRVGREAGQLDDARGDPAAAVSPAAGRAPPGPAAR